MLNYQRVESLSPNSKHLRRHRGFALDLSWWICRAFVATRHRQEKTMPWSVVPKHCISAYIWAEHTGKSLALYCTSNKVMFRPCLSLSQVAHMAWLLFWVLGACSTSLSFRILTCLCACLPTFLHINQRICAETTYMQHSLFEEPSKYLGVSENRLNP